MNSRWLFARHAESVANAQGWLAGHHNAPLTPRGRDQALAVAPHIGEVKRAFSSDSHRAIHTAELLLGDRAGLLQQRLDLRERHLGDWEGLLKQDLQGDGRWDTLLSWRGQPPGGESQLMVCRRMLGALAALDTGDGPTLVVSHGTALRVVLGLLEDIHVEAIGRVALGNVQLIERELPVGVFAERLARLTPG